VKNQKYLKSCLQDGFGSMNLGINSEFVASNLSGSIPGSSFSMSNGSFAASAANGSFSSSGFNMQHIPQLPLSSPEMAHFSFHSSNDGASRGSLVNPGELSMMSGVQAMPSVRINPLAVTGPLLDNGNGQVVHQGYGQAVSDYAAALQMKYGNAIPDLSAPKTSSQLYFSNQRKSSKEVMSD